MLTHVYTLYYDIFWYSIEGEGARRNMIVLQAAVHTLRMKVREEYRIIILHRLSARSEPFYVIRNQNAEKKQSISDAKNGEN